MPKPEAQMTDAVATALLAAALDRLFAAEPEPEPEHARDERTAAELLSQHLEGALRERRELPAAWSVDLEPGLPGLERERRSAIPPLLASVAGELGWSRLGLLGGATRPLGPDLVIHRHRRGAAAEPLVICELTRLDADQRELARDLVKLAVYRRALGHAHAFLLVLGARREDCIIHPANTAAAEIARDVRRLHESAAMRRWKRGQATAAHRARGLLALRGPQPAQAVAESRSALNALDAMGQWPAPRDRVSEQAIQHVRRRWARVQRRAKHARSR